MRILVIEDHIKVSSAIQKGLVKEGFNVSICGNGEEGLRRLLSEPFDLVILDVMLPGKNGFEIVSSMRATGLRIPVLMLTARDAVEDRVKGLEKGADDYLVKPFAFPELIARIKALLRRGKADQPVFFKIADLEMDLVKRTVSRAGNVLTLTVKEFQLLEYFLKNLDSVVSREMLARDVWHETKRVTPLDNVIDVHVARLRKKIDDPFENKLLHTVRGVGFIMEKKEDA
jgi:two-component system, OmpR family, copper resistance phosphate regulon response regulator CusR